MPDDLQPGLHEALITRELLEALEQLEAAGWAIERKDLDDSAMADVLAGHIRDRTLAAIAAVPVSAADRRTRQLAIANGVLGLLGGGDSTPVPDPGRILLEIQRPSWPSGQVTPRPDLSLRNSALLVN